MVEARFLSTNRILQKILFSLNLMNRSPTDQIGRTARVTYPDQEWPANQYDEYGFEKSRQPGRIPVFIPFSRLCEDTKDTFPKFGMLLKYHLFMDMNSILKRKEIKQLISQGLTPEDTDQLIVKLMRQTPDLNALKEYVLEQQAFHHFHLAETH